MIDEVLLSEIRQYCEINNILDFEKELNSILRKGFQITKYGNSPFEKMKEQSSLNQDNIIQEKKKKTVKKSTLDKKVNADDISLEIKEEKQDIEPIKKKRVRIIKNQ